MRARWLVAVGIGATFGATAAFVACASGSGSVPPPGRPAAAAPTPPPGHGPAPASSTGSEPADAGHDLAMAVAEARRCDTPRATIRNHPNGGAVFNNAMTGEDAGSIDRMAGVVQALAGRVDAFRCCFDHWLAAHQASEVQIMLQVALDPNGAVESAAVDPSRSSGGDEVLGGCLAAIASETTFPPSPRGTPTLVEYPFDVAAAP
jgi:hypothetical protein